MLSMADPSVTKQMLLFHPCIPAVHSPLAVISIQDNPYNGSDTKYRIMICLLQLILLKMVKILVLVLICLPRYNLIIPHMVLLPFYGLSCIDLHNVNYLKYLDYKIGPFSFGRVDIGLNNLTLLYVPSSHSYFSSLVQYGTICMIIFPLKNNFHIL